MPVLARTKVDRHYRTTVPREVRKVLEISSNDTIEWVLVGEHVVVRKGGQYRELGAEAI
jgi:AbrB family looped-hinge helix DNA binding protein